MRTAIIVAALITFNNEQVLAKSKQCAPESPSLLNFACENNESWTIGLGVDAEYGFAADGSKEKKAEFEPGIILHASNNWGQLFLEGQEAGGRIFAGDSFNFGLVARLESGRKEADDPKLLAGQGDTEDEIMARPEFRVNLYGNWNVWFGGTSLIGDGDIGNLHIAILGLGINKVGILDLELLLSQRWGTSAFINKDFGVNSEQSARNGLPLYSATTGAQSSSAALVGKVDWSKSFKTVFELGYDKYDSRLDESPIIKRGQNWEYEIGATILYLF